MEILFEVVFQFLAELFLQGAFEGVADLIVGRIKSERAAKFLIAAFLGFVAGLCSLALFGQHFIDVPMLRYAGALVGPVWIGFVMAWIGRARAKRGSAPRSLEHFFNAWGFAFAFAIVRVALAK